MFLHVKIIKSFKTPTHLLDKATSQPPGTRSIHATISQPPVSWTNRVSVSFRFLRGPHPPRSWNFKSPMAMWLSAPKKRGDDVCWLLPPPPSLCLRVWVFWRGLRPLGDNFQTAFSARMWCQNKDSRHFFIRGFHLGLFVTTKAGKQKSHMLHVWSFSKRGVHSANWSVQNISNHINGDSYGYMIYMGTGQGISSQRDLGAARCN